MDLIDLEDESIDAEVMDSLAVSMDNFRVSFIHIFDVSACSARVRFGSPFKENSIVLMNKLLCYSLALVTLEPYPMNISNFSLDFFSLL